MIPGTNAAIAADGVIMASIGIDGEKTATDKSFAGGMAVALIETRAAAPEPKRYAIQTAPLS